MTTPDQTSYKQKIMGGKEKKGWRLGFCISMETLCCVSWAITTDNIVNRFELVIPKSSNVLGLTNKI
jgi:hypothetical protein